METTSSAPTFFRAEQAEQLDLRLAVTDDVVGDYANYIRCREHNDTRRGNLAVYRDHLHCYVCGFHVTKPMEALAYLLKVDFETAISLAPRYTDASLDGYRAKAALENRRDPLPRSLATLYHETLYGLRAARLPWLGARGLTDETLRRFLIGHDGARFTIPIFDAADQLIALRFRRDDVYGGELGAKYCGLKGRNGRYLFPEHLLTEMAPRVVVICEGELDAVRLWQEGIPAATVTNGAGQLRTLPQLLRDQVKSVQALLVAGDMDEPGREATRLTVEAATLLGYQAVPLAWERGKDVTEALQLGSLSADRLRTTCNA